MLYIYNNLKYIREKNKLSKNAFAEKLGLNVSNISRWENSKNGMSLDTALDISEKLNIPLPDLVGKDLSVEYDITLDEKHSLDMVVLEKSKELTETDKQFIINMIDNLKDRSNE